MTIMSNELFTKLFAQAKEEELDFYKLVAVEMFGGEYDDVTREMRRGAKSVSYIWLYSTGGLAESFYQ